jgi:hypothetical protein
LNYAAKHQAERSDFNYYFQVNHFRNISHPNLFGFAAA